MALRRRRTDNLAISMLAREGIAAIWSLHLAAARAHRDGHKAMAATIIEICGRCRTRVVAPRQAATPLELTNHGSQRMRVRWTARNLRQRTVHTGQLDLAIAVFSWLAVFALISAMIADAFR
jgi:hypothetical protein